MSTICWHGTIGLAAAGRCHRPQPQHRVAGAPTRLAAVMPGIHCGMPPPASVKRCGDSSSASRWPSRSTSTMPVARAFAQSRQRCVVPKLLTGWPSMAVIRRPSASTPHAGCPARCRPPPAAKMARDEPDSGHPCAGSVLRRQVLQWQHAGGTVLPSAGARPGHRLVVEGGDRQRHRQFSGGRGAVAERMTRSPGCRPAWAAMP